MDVSHFPDDILLKIFEYLPIQDCARLGRVNKSFHRMSQSTISRTKVLDFAESYFHKLSADQLAVILDLCSTNLEKIEFPNEGYLTIGVQSPEELATTLANYECPRLTVIDLGVTYIEYAVFEQLIRNNPNLESLIWDTDFVGFPNVTSNSLKKLYLHHVNNDTLQSMTGRIPNLEELALSITTGTANVLDAFFASSQQIKDVVLRLIRTHIVFDESLVSFWNLPLTSLVICHVYCGKVDLHKVVTSFPHLQTLKVSRSRYRGISSLAALQELEFLKLDLSNATDDEIRSLVGCKKLLWLYLESNITKTYVTAGTLITLLRGCPHLDTVMISNINEVDTPEEAAIVLGCLSGLAKPHIEIRFNRQRMKEMEESLIRFIWDSEEVHEAIKNLQQNEGIEVYICWKWGELEEMTE